MGKEKLLFASCVMGVSLLFSGCNNTQKTSEGQTVSSKGAQTVKEENAKENNELSFEDVNVVGNELIKRDNDSYEEIIANFRITNNGTEDIDYFSADFAYFDENGNEICKDGRFHDCQIKSGRSALITSYSRLDGQDKSVIDKIELISYKYRIGNKHCSVNLQTKEFSEQEYSSETSNVDYDSVNILEFNNQPAGVDSLGSYKVDVQIHNNGQIPVKYCSYRMVYLDADGNNIDIDGRFSDTLLSPGNYNQSKSFCDDEQSANVSDCLVFSYNYDLTENDSNGFNHYEINVQTKTAVGSSGN